MSIVSAFGLDRTYQSGEFIDSQSIGMKTQIMFEIVLDNHLHMFSKDLKSMEFFHAGIVDQIIAFLEVSPKVGDMCFNVF